jgi:chorismate dehydratase
MLKVGKIEYLNTVPVYYGFVKGVVRAPNVEFVENVPTELNRLLRKGLLDVSVVSSYEYIDNYESYLLLPDLSISAKKKVMSVLFFSTVPIHQLHRKDVWITKSSLTSRELLKFLLKEVYGVEPNFRYYSVKEGNLPKNPSALLSIGDDALKLLEEKRFPFVYDLAEEWFNLTELPFVFAVWAVRKESYESKREELTIFYQNLLKSRGFGEKNFESICKEYGKKIGLKEKTCLTYLNCLNFHLGEEEVKSLLKFGEKLGKTFSLRFAET